jgi:hypothetical protein
VSNRLALKLKSILLKTISYGFPTVVAAPYSYRLVEELLEHPGGDFVGLHCST